MVECDEEGWVYSDHKWSNQVTKYDLNDLAMDGHADNTKALTRRRRWYRKAIPIPQR